MSATLLISLKSVGCDDGAKVSFNQKQDIIPKVKHCHFPKGYNFLALSLKISSLQNFTDLHKTMLKIFKDVNNFLEMSLDFLVCFITSPLF